MNKKRFSFNKITFFLVLIYFVCGIGLTYAYFAFMYEDTSTIVGNVVNIDATLTVERVVGTDTKLVPMMDAALSNALLGTGSDNGACIDSLGNLSCQVYEITLTNNASRLQHLVGTIELYPKSESSNAYRNLKWQELDNTTTTKDDSIINGMNKSILVSGLTLESKESKTWYVGVWLSETENDQKDIDKGEFGGTVTFEVIEGLTEGIVGSFNNEFTKSIMIPNAINDESIDFSKSATETGTNGIYVRNGTQNNPYPIYYYRGAVDNNLIFADFCWKVVRTTETGGLKLIYNGIPTDGTCDNTGNATNIATLPFNTSSNSLAHVGYMYGDVYPTESKDMSTDTTEYIYGSNISYSNGLYTLTGGTISGAWSSVYNGGLNNHHYTCFTTETTCENIYYVYYTIDSTAHYVQLKEGEKIEDAISKMLDKNETSSTIKGSSTTPGTLDYWYYENIEKGRYKRYIEDTVWCNDRNISDLIGWNPDGGDTTIKNLYFGARDRLRVTYNPTLTCTRKIDQFTESPNNGNGDLDYPIGLLTADEMMLAGGKAGGTNNTFYLYSGSDFWSLSPHDFTGGGYAYGLRIFSTGNLNISHIAYSPGYGVRPSISLKNGFKLIGEGDGRASNPYVVDTTIKDELTTVVITFDPNEGTVDTTSKEVRINDTIGELPTPERVGYTFNGWYTEVSGGDKIESTTMVETISGTTLHAQWTINTYTISYYNGTTKIDTSSHIYGTAKNLTTWANLGATVTNSGVGWTFTGWSSANDNTTRNYTDGASVNNLTETANGNINLYAVYSRTITFKHGVSAASSSTATQYWNPTGTTNGTHVGGVTSPSLTAITNWTASGFRDDTTAGEKEYDANTSIYPIPGESAILYGTYTRNIVFYSGVSNGTNHGTRTQYLNSNSNAVSAITSYTPATITNWSALGFRNDTTATSQSYGSNTSISPAYTTGNNMYAVYSRTLTISYNGNSNTSGSTGNTTKTVYLNSNSTTTSSQAVTLAANGFGRTGYTFSKWAEASAGGTQYGASTSYNPNLAYNASTFGTTMFAVWNGNSYTVSFNANGGSVGTGSKTVTYGSTYGTLPTPTQNGYSFNGWYTASSGGTKITSSTTVSITSAQTLYAQWSVAPLVLYDNGNNYANFTSNNSYYTLEDSAIYLKGGIRTSTQYEMNSGTINVDMSKYRTLKFTLKCTGYYTDSTGEGIEVYTVWKTSGGSTTPIANIVYSMNVDTTVTISVDASSATDTYTSMYFKIRTFTDDGINWWKGYVYKIWLEP